MTQGLAGSLETTHLHAVRQPMGARRVLNDGWDVPVQYATLLEEPRAIPSHPGLFDMFRRCETEPEGPAGTVPAGIFATRFFKGPR